MLISCRNRVVSFVVVAGVHSSWLDVCTRNFLIHPSSNSKGDDELCSEGHCGVVRMYSYARKKVPNVHSVLFSPEGENSSLPQQAAIRTKNAGTYPEEERCREV